MLFTEFAEGGYNIYAMLGDEMTGTPVMEMEAATVDTLIAVAGLLPPVPRPTEPAFNRVSQMLADSKTGLPTAGDATDFDVLAYRPRLGLDYLGQPQVGVSVGGGAFGSGGLYGGIFGIFSDILARHLVYGAVQAQGQVDEVGFSLQYLNQRERWNFGGSAQRIPIVYGGYRDRYDPDNDAFVQEISRFRLFDSSIQGFAQYPFSPLRRVEFSTGLRRVASDEQLYEFFFDRQTGIFLGEQQRQVDGLSLNLFETSAALIYDSSLLGWTSPFAGQRYRFQVTPTFGQLQFVQGLADYRKYAYLQPFTMAVRGLHVGRYGPDAEATFNDRQVFQDLYLGQPWYVRGYYGVYSDCLQRQGQSQDCLLLQQLLGSRISVVNAELRFPLIRQLVIGNSIGLPPIEGFIFGDAGLAWTQATSPVFKFDVPASAGDRGIMSSFGAGARINVLGMLVVEIDYVKPLVSERDWHWQFSFVPGF
jgi:hypothetical protein